MTKEELHQLIEQGEGYHLEFKRRLNTDFKKEIVSFANASGGKVLLGVNDDGTIPGINADNDLRSRVQTDAQSCDPPVRINLEVNRNVLIVHVPEGDRKPYRTTEGFYLRVGPNAQKMTTDQIRDFMESEGRVRFDEVVRRDVDFRSTMSEKLVDQFLAMAGIKNVFQNREHLLHSLGVAKWIDNEVFFNNAGILLFTEHPGFVIPQSTITCVAYSGTDKVDILDRKDFDQDLITSITSAMNFMKRHLNVSAEISGLQRKDILELPEVALREALVNAVVHRNYLETGARVMVEVFRDKVVISSPGGLPKGLSWDNFGKYSMARNPMLADLFLRVGLIEKLGTGVNRIRTAMKKAKMAEPKFEGDGFFAVTLLRPSGEKGGTKGGAIGGTIEDPGGTIGGQTGGLINVAITKAQKRVFDLLVDDPHLSQREMAEKLSINTSAVQKHIVALKEKGAIERVGGTRGYWKVKQ